MKTILTRMFAGSLVLAAALAVLPASASAQATPASALAGCVANQLGIDQALTSVGNALGSAVDSVLGIQPNPSQAATKLANEISNTLTSGAAVPGTWGLVGGPGMAGTGYGVFPVNVTTVSDSNQLAYFSGSNGNLSQIAGNASNQNAYQQCKQPLLQSIGEAAAAQLVQNLTEATVNWINTGFNGQPAFQDIGNFLTQTADQTVGNFLAADPDLKFLCSPFQTQVILALGYTYSPLTQQQQIKCTLSSAVTNATNFANSLNGFSQNGGWDTWLQLTTQPQNNAQGAFLLMKSKLDNQIAANQQAAQTEVIAGQGSLSYSKCDLETFSPQGQIVPGKTTAFYGSPLLFKSTTDQGGYYTKLANCTVATPGAVITSMLGMQANSTNEQLNLRAALSNGLDDVLTALVNLAANKLLGSTLQTGVLGDNSSYYNGYSSAIDTAAQQAVTTYNSGSTSVLPNYNGLFSTTTTGLFNDLNASSSAQTQQIANQASDPLYTPRSEAIIRLDGLENQEIAYQSTWLTASNTLAVAEADFTAARNCNAGYNDSADALRAFLINANVITNIDGTPDSSRSIASIPWNFTVIANNIAVSNQHLALLDTALTAVNAASTAQAITDALTPINSASFNTDPETGTVTDIKTWLSGVQGMYSTQKCPIDISNALAISGPATPGNTVTTGSFSTASSTGN